MKLKVVIIMITAIIFSCSNTENEIIDADQIDEGLEKNENIVLVDSYAKNDTDEKETNVMEDDVNNLIDEDMTDDGIDKDIAYAMDEDSLVDDDPNKDRRGKVIELNPIIDDENFIVESAIIHQSYKSTYMTGAIIVRYVGENDVCYKASDVFFKEREGATLFSKNLFYKNTRPAFTGRRNNTTYSTREYPHGYLTFMYNLSDLSVTFDDLASVEININYEPCTCLPPKGMLEVVGEPWYEADQYKWFFKLKNTGDITVQADVNAIMKDYKGRSLDFTFFLDTSNQESDTWSMLAPGEEKVFREGALASPYIGQILLAWDPVENKTKSNTRKIDLLKRLKNILEKDFSEIELIELKKQLLGFDDPQ